MNTQERKKKQDWNEESKEGQQGLAEAEQAKQGQL